MKDMCIEKAELDKAIADSQKHIENSFKILLLEIQRDLKEVVTQTTLTNNRVNKLELKSLEEMRKVTELQGKFEIHEAVSPTEERIRRLEDDALALKSIRKSLWVGFTGIAVLLSIVTYFINLFVG